MENLEAKIEQQCNIILKTEPEFWETRNKAVLALTALISAHEGMYVIEHFTPNCSRSLKESLKSMILDLRSQQVRDTCNFLMKLSLVLGDHIKAFMRDFFSILLDALKVPNKVMSGYVDECILNMIKNSTFKSCFQQLVTDIKENKSKVVREHCVEYVNEILIHWDITDKDADVLCEAIKFGLQDASVRSREVSRLAYLNLFTSFPKKTERLKAGLSVLLRNKLTKAEEDHTRLLQAAEEKKFRPLSPTSSPDRTSSNDESTLRGEIASLGAIATASLSKTPGKPLALRARRQSYEEHAVTSIQAVVRGALTRRLSMTNKDLAAVNEWEDDDLTGDSSPSISTKLSVKSMIPKISPAASPMSSPNPRSPSDFPSPLEADKINASYPSHLSVGLVVGLRGKEGPQSGTIRFIGTTSFATGYWVGLELPAAEGKNNGAVQGQVYFTCPDNCGLFVRPSAVRTLIHSPSRLSALTFMDKSKRAKLCGLMKLKVSLTMDLLSQQLDIIEHFESLSGGGTNDSNGDSYDRDVTLKSKDLLALCDQERVLWENFNAKLQSLR